MLEKWEDAYADKTSEAYKTFANSIKKSIEELYRAKRSISNDYNIMANLGMQIIILFFNEVIFDFSSGSYVSRSEMAPLSRHLSVGYFK